MCNGIPGILLFNSLCSALLLCPDEVVFYHPFLLLYLRSAQIKIEMATAHTKFLNVFAKGQNGDNE